MSAHRSVGTGWDLADRGQGTTLSKTHKSQPSSMSPLTTNHPDEHTKPFLAQPDHDTWDTAPLPPFNLRPFPIPETTESFPASEAKELAISVHPLKTRDMLCL